MGIGMLGLRRMCGNMARRLLKGGHRVVGYNRSAVVTRKIENEPGLTPALSIEVAMGLLPALRVGRVMVPAGDATHGAIGKLATLLFEGDIIIDGGNTFYKDDIRRAQMLEPRGIHYVDSGTSGGIWGLKEGHGLRIGGEPAVVEYLRPIFETLVPATDQGWGHNEVGGHAIKKAE